MRQRRQALFALYCLTVVPAVAAAQGTGIVRGTVTRAGDRAPLDLVRVAVAGSGPVVTSNAAGGYVLLRVPAGAQVLEFSRLGQRPQRREVVVAAGADLTLDVQLDAAPIELGALIVEAASRTPEPLLDAPAAVTQVRPGPAEVASLGGQTPLALASVPGVDLAQVGLTDFNVNSRGFNTALARRVLVLLDGRDLAEPLLMFQEWPAFSMGLDDIERIEVVRGPGSALYGANAYNGVIDIRTPPVREVVGSRLRVGGGGQDTRRLDLRHAGLAWNGRLGFRVSFGYQRAADWSRSRTRLDGQDFAAEYAPVTDSLVPPSPGYEVVPLRGQTRDSLTGAARGTPFDLESLHGSARLDVYRDDGSLITLDGGMSRARNTVLVTEVGRVQVPEVTRPWVRVAWEGSRHFLMASYSARSQADPSISLGTGAEFDDKSSVLQLDARYGRPVAGERARVQVGATFRDVRLNTFGTLMDPAGDDRSDLFYGAYGEVDVRPRPWLRLIAAARLDDSELYARQFSPKLAAVIVLARRHSLRASINRAFLVPTGLQYFFRAPAGVQDFTALENGLRASPLGPALAGVPPGELFTTSAAVPVVAVGNTDVVPQRMSSYEVGYRGQLRPRLFVTADAYFSRDRDFVTRLVPATVVNRRYPTWTAPPEVPVDYRDDVEGAVRGALAGTVAELGLTRQADGSTAIVLSNGNAGVVDEWGTELGAELALSDALHLATSFTLFRYEVQELSVGAVLLPNTPTHKATLAATWSGPAGLTVRGDVRILESFEWETGVFRGRVPAGTTVNLGAAWRVSHAIEADVAVTNLLDQQQFQMFGGAVLRRRVLVAVAVTR